MPRLTAKRYLYARDQLRRFWLTDEGLYAELTPTEQWQLHDYFQPGKDWPAEQLLKHRAQITKERPSLPHQAGRALSKFQERVAQVALLRVRGAKRPIAAGRPSRGERHLEVKAVVRPEPDLKKLSRALIAVALERQVRADAGDPTDSASPRRAA